jgi:hypothetical protein
LGLAGVGRGVLLGQGHDSSKAAESPPISCLTNSC